MRQPVDNNVLRLADERLARKHGGAGGAPPETSGLPAVRIIPGQLPRAIDGAEAALIAQEGHGLYRFGNSLVRVAWDDIRVSGGGSERSLRHSIVNAAGLIEGFAKVARFEKWSKTEENWVACDCPKQLAESYLARDGRWKVPPLLGVVTAPTLRPDGTLISRPGYDAATGLVYDPSGVDFGALEEEPTRGDAEWGLKNIKKLIRKFRFASDADRSVALSGIITAVVRQSMATAPMHAFDAPVAGSGKSLLVDLAAIIATGHRAAVMATGSDKYGDNEVEKRLSAAVLGGDPIVSMDNLNDPLDGQLLCQLLTQHSVKIRPFGKLQNITIPSIATYFANGNNLVVLGDLTRRVLVGRIDPQVERPELEAYAFEPIALARRARVMLVKCCLAIVMAHQQSDSKRRSPLGSFEDWSYLVRDALVWLGEADPCDVMERTRAADPRMETLRAVVRAWYAAFHTNPVRVKDVIESISIVRTPGTFDESFCPEPELRAAMVGFAAGPRGDLSPERIGKWLRQNLGRRILVEGFNYHFNGESGSHGTIWSLKTNNLASAPLPAVESNVDDIPF